MDIVAALEELHSMGLYHRDLKPQNVLRFKADVGTDYYAVSDFGFITLNDSRLSALTTTGMKRGSDFYTAPEIVKDLRNASAQSDIYSLGCIVHDMIGTGDRIPCNEIREEGPYAGVLLGCTRQNKNQRFKSVRAVAEALQSIDDEGASISSPQAETLALEIDGTDALSTSLPGKLVEFFDTNASPSDSRALLRKLTTERIQEICANFSAEAEKIGVVFARWVHESSFDFDFCDTVAARLRIFIEHCSLSLKAECLLAMLELGTSHNRWYVERMFMSLCGPSMEANLAKRLGVEMRVAGEDICKSIAHLENSIRTNRDLLHPALVRTLKEVCP